MSSVGAGLASSLPGALLRDFGAEVAVVESAAESSLDAGVEFARVWNRGKEIVRIGEGEDATGVVRALADEADVAFVMGPEPALEGRGLLYSDLARSNPGLVEVRIRPSDTAQGLVPDLELLVTARLDCSPRSGANGRGPNSMTFRWRRPAPP